MDKSSDTEDFDRIPDFFKNNWSRKNYERQKGNDGSTPLHLASAHGHTALCRFYLNCGVNIFDEDCFGLIPPMMCILHGHLDTLRLFLEFNPEFLNYGNVFGKTPLKLAVSSGNVKVVKEIEERCRAGLRQADLEDALFLACSYGYLDTIHFLLDLNPSLLTAVQPNTGMTPLMVAVCCENPRAVQLFINRNENIYLRDSEGRTALDIAKIINNQEIIQLFPVLILVSPRLRSSLDSNILKQVSYKSPRTNFLRAPLAGKKSERRSLTPVLEGSKQKSPREKLISWKNGFRRRFHSDGSVEEKSRCENFDRSNSGFFLEYILEAAKLSDLYKLFKSHEVTFSTFLSMNEDDLIKIGVKKSGNRKQLLTIIDHYREIFNFYYIK